jgi:hypothetical protein
MKNKIGSFAICNNNQLGLILYETQVVVKRTNKSHTLYHGICLSPQEKYGCNWQSKNPKFLNKNQFQKLWKKLAYDRLLGEVKNNGFVEALKRYKLIKDKEINEVLKK